MIFNKKRFFPLWPGGGKVVKVGISVIVIKSSLNSFGDDDGFDDVVGIGAGVGGVLGVVVEDGV